MATIVWTPLAEGDLLAALDRMRSAGGNVDDFLQTVDGDLVALSESPYRGDIGRVTATREWQMARHDYLAVYMVMPAQITVLRLLSTAMASA